MKAIICTIVALLLSSCSSDCEITQINITTSIGVVSYQVEVVDGILSRAQGLMNREPLPRGAGMLFLYKRETRVSFWMKSVLSPPDIIFIDSAGNIIKIHENALPHDLTPIQSVVPIIGVLELRGGTVKLDQIALNDAIDVFNLRKLP